MCFSGSVIFPWFVRVCVCVCVTCVHAFEGRVPLYRHYSPVSVQKDLHLWLGVREPDAWGAAAPGPKRGTLVTLTPGEVQQLDSGHLHQLASALAKTSLVLTEGGWGCPWWWLGLLSPWWQRTLRVSFSPSPCTGKSLWKGPVFALGSGHMHALT